VQEETGGGDAGERRPEVIDFLEQEQRPGLPGLDRAGFRTIVQRFCQLTGLPVPEVGCPWPRQQLCMLVDLFRKYRK
jgi:hypothetical protein